MKNSRKGVVSAAAIAIIAIIIFAGGLLVYKQIDWQPKQPASVGSGDNAGKTESCPEISAPGPEFCPGGEILAKATGGCVMGYECKEPDKKITSSPATADISCAIDSDCVDPGCGECVNEKWDAANTSCAVATAERKICKCVTQKCVAKTDCGDGKCDPVYETKINCSQDCGLAEADKTCKSDADCVDDGTTCHVCVNSVWIVKNPDWSRKYACDGIGAATCLCQSGQCAAIGESEADAN